MRHTTLTPPARSGSARPQPPSPAAVTLAPPTPPDPAGTARRFVMGLLEVEAGRRNPGQLERWCAPDLWARIQARIGQHGGRPPTSRTIYRVHCQELRPGVVDAVVMAWRGRRIQPIALRLVARGGRWLVADLALRL